MWRWDSQAGTTVGEVTLQNPQITEATRRWVSEADIPPGRRGSADDGRGMDGLMDMERPLTGGFASPIAADGKVFHFFYRPTGTVYDTQRASVLGIDIQGRPLPVEGDTLSREQALDRILAGEVGDMDLLMEAGFGEEKKAEAGNEPEVHMPRIEGNLVRGNERWLVAAKDILVAIDQETGKTVWQTVLTDKGLNYGFFGKGASAITPVYHDGMVVALGTSAKVFGVDAKSGQIRWIHKLQPRHDRHMRYLQDALEGRSMAARFNRDMLTALVAADGLVIVNDQRWHRVDTSGGTTYHYDTFNSYVDLDVRTGEVKWEAPEVGAGGSNPKVVNLGGKNYVLAVSLFHLTLLDLATGETVWQSGEGHHSPTCAFNLGVSNEYVIMAARAEGGRDRSLKGYRLSLNGLEPLWSWGRIREYRSNILIAGDVAYMHVDGQLRAFHPATGETIREVPVGDIRPAGGNPFIAHYGGWLFTRAVNQGPENEEGFWVMSADPEQMAETQRFFEADIAKPYFVLTFPAFANRSIFFRTDHSYKIEAYRLD